MPDPRFFESLGPVSLGDLAVLTGAELVKGDAGRPIAVAAPLDRADASAVSFLADRKYAADLATSAAAACFMIAQDIDLAPEGCAVLVVRSPQAAWTAAAARLHAVRQTAPNDRPIHPQAELEDDVTVAFGALICAGARIGRGTTIGAGAVIGAGVTIGRDCWIGPNATVGFALIGDRVSLWAGAVIGEAGFGATAGPAGLIDIPQLGRVILQDGVTVGANSCIDRGAWEDTVIGENTKIDNLVQIAHNCRIGRNCAIAAQVGIAGSTIVGDGVQFGGQVGIADHAVIGDGARIAAQAGITKGVPEGETWAGYPARPARQWARETAWIAMNAGRKGRKG